MADIRIIKGKKHTLCWCKDGGVEHLEIKTNHKQDDLQCSTYYDKDTHDAISDDDYQKILDKIAENDLKDKDKDI